MTSGILCPFEALEDEWSSNLVSHGNHAVRLVAPAATLDAKSVAAVWLAVHDTQLVLPLQKILLC